MASLTHEYHSPDKTPALYVAPYNDNGTALQLTGVSLTDANALHVAIVDGNGDQITSFTGGTQYTDAAAAAAHPIGTGIIFNNAGTYNFVSAAQPLPVTGSVTVGEQTDNAAFTAGTTTGIPMMGFYHSTIDTVTDGRAAALAIDSKRNLFVVIRDAAGNARGLNIDASGQLAVTGTFWQATQPVSGTFWQATQPISASSLPLPTGAATETTLAALNTKINTEITADYDTGVGTQTMKLVGIALPASGGAVAGGTATNPIQVSLANTAANSTAVKVDGSAVTQPVSGTFWQATQPVSIASTLSDNLAQINAHTVLETVHGTNTAGNGGLSVGLMGEFDDTSPTSITENQFGNVRMSANRNLYVNIRDNAGNERGLNIDASGQLAITVAASQTIAVTNTGTFAVQATPVTQVDTFMLGGINIKEINAVTPLMGTGNGGTGSLRVNIASDQVSIPVASTLTAETTKVIGTVNPALIASVIVGQKKLTASAVQLGSNALTNGVIFTALSTNAGNIFIGGSSVNTTADGTGNGFILEPGASISAACTNTNLFYVIGTANDVLSFFGS